jgi:hypothetical protein
LKLYLLESLGDLALDKGSTIIALTPEACYGLDRRGIKYSIPKDYYIEQDLVLPKDYFDLCTQWATGIDNALFKYIDKIREYNLRLAELYSFYFRHSILDQLFAKCFVVNRIIEALKPSEVVFVTNCLDDTVLGFTFQSTGKSYYYQIVSSICKQNNLPMECIVIRKQEESKKRLRVVFDKGESATLVSLLFGYKCLTSSIRKRAAQKLNIFLPKTAHIGLGFVADAVRRGHNVYGVDTGFTTIYTSLGIRKHSKLNLHPEVLSNVDEILEQRELYTCFNEYLYTDVSEITLLRLRHFIQVICPLFLAYYKAYLEFYKEAQIDTLVMAHDALPYESAALLAANYCGLNTVCISHGDGVYSYKNWDTREAQLYRTIIASNLERKEYYERLGTKHAYVSPHRLQSQLKLGGDRKSRTVGRKVIYLTTFMAGDNRGIDGGAYSDTWLYAFQKALVEYFSTRRDYLFIFEALPASDLLYNPIPSFIRDGKFSNVLYSTKPFLTHLKSTDRVICDIPSTGFYEAISAGVPVVSLCPTNWTYRQSALDYFGQLVKPFSSIAEAISHIDKFLNSGPSEYVMNLDTGSDSILDILESQCH